MNGPLRVQRWLTGLVIAGFVLFWGGMWLVNGAPEFSEQYAMSAIFLSIVGAPWVFAVRVLWRAWCRRQDVDLETMDGPALLLTTALGALPDERRPWGKAMQAELAAAPSGWARWRFACGCVRTALFPPQSNRAPALLAFAATLVLIFAAGPILASAAPEMRLFGLAFLGLIGAAATLVVARRHAPGVLQAQPLTLLAVAVGILACVGMTAYFLEMNPESSESFTLGPAIRLAVILAVCFWLALAAPGGMAGNEIAQYAGVGTALFLGSGYLVTSRLTIDTMAGPFIWLLLAPQIACFMAAAISAARERSFSAGVQAAAWAVLVGTLLIYAISLPEAMHRYAIDGRILGDGEAGHPIGVNLVDAVFCTTALPVLGLPMGVIGAAAGAAWRRKRSATGLPS